MSLFILGMLTGCVEFTGEFNRIGFASELVLGDGRSWTPDSPVVAGTTFAVAAVHRVGEDGERMPAVTPKPTGALRVIPRAEGGWDVHGGDGRLLWDGETSDRFRVRFAEPVAADAGPVGLDSGDFAIPVGVDCALQVGFADAKGELLGFRTDDLALVVDGVFTETEAGIRAVAPGASDLSVELGARVFAGPRVSAVPASAITWEVIEEPGDDGRTSFRLAAVADGLPVGCVALEAWVNGQSVLITPDGSDLPAGTDPVFAAVLWAPPDPG